MENLYIKSGRNYHAIDTLFTEEELTDLEFCMNKQIELCQTVKRNTAEWEEGATAKKIQCDTEILRLSILLEKIRKL